MSTARTKQLLTAKPAKKIIEGGLSTGVSTLNAAISGHTSWALTPGKYVLLVGKSRAGKSWLARQILAEAAKNPFYAKYRLIDDDPEHGVLMDQKRFFGKRMADRVEPPSKHGCSRTHEEFYRNLENVLEEGEPCIYVIDSEDALWSEADDKAARKKEKAATRSGEDAKGSYGTTKAKTNSARLPKINDLLDRTGSILIVIKQSRDNIGFGSMFEPETRSGGRALTFYAAIECWFSIVGKIKKTVRGKPRVIGSMLRVTVKKNRVAGRDRSATFPFYPSHGVDDLGSMVGFLIEENHWQEKKGIVTADEFDFTGNVEKLIAKIEAENGERALRKIVGSVWKEIESLCDVKRKPRYT